MSDIGFTGPSGEYHPHLGQNDISSTTSFIEAAIPAEVMPQHVLDDLSSLSAICQQTITELENELLKFSLPVLTSNINLTNAVRITWPNNLGIPSGYVTYRYYKYLGNINNSASDYIRNIYETACRSVAGTNAIDLLPIVKILLSEATLAKEFIQQNIGLLSDSSQKRVLELLQEWVTNAITHAGNVRAIFEAAGQTLNASELQSLGATDASQSQALFQTNLNQGNQQIVQDLSLLQTDFHIYADTFYNNYIKPAIDFRQNVTAWLTPIYPGQLGAELTSAQNNIDSHLSSLLTDMLRRSNVFIDRVTTILTEVHLRDSYRQYIIQLQDLGITVSSSAQMIQSTDPSAQASFFDNATATTIVSPATPNFTAPHGSLDNLTDVNAHPQYFLKSGDVLSGDLLLTPDATLDGVIPSTHAHTGHDGTVKIHGGDLLSGSVTSDSVDTTNQPTVPVDLHVISAAVTTVPPGVSQVTVVLEWNGDPNVTHEIQMSPTVM